MSSIDNRIVSMRFDNGQFNSGVSDTLSALGKLKQALLFPGASKGLNDIKTDAAKFNMDSMEGSVTGVSKSFLALSTVALTALATITSKVVTSGLQIGKSLSIDPILAGFREYELKMGSIQTILANTARYGTGLNEVTDALDELNTYADKTIYNFGDMTKNIGLFTNAGIRIEDATSMIQGFSNVAAASGTNAQGAASAAYQLSQALSAGTIRLMDWRSLTNVGMGNKNMQEGLIQIAEAMGAFEGTTIDANIAAKDFNASLEKKWLSADVMENYLKIMAGKVTPAQMKALGLTAKQIETFSKQAKTAEEAATKVRTWTQLVSTVQEAIGSGWSQTFDILVGDFNGATALFTELNDAISGVVGRAADARNALLEGWAKAGGRTAVIDGLRSGLQALSAVLGTIKGAFRDVFPPITAKKLAELSERFRDFMEQLKPGQKTLDNLRRIFTGIFSILKIGVTIIKGVFGVFASFFSAIFNSADGFSDLLARIGDFLTGVGKVGSAGGIVERVFAKVEEGVGRVVGSFDTFLSLLGNVASGIKDFASNALGGLGDIFKNVFAGFDINTLIKGIGAGGLATIGLALRKMVKDGIGVNFGGGFLDGISDALGGLTGVLKSMEQNLKANALLKIAGAIAILTASLVVLASLDTEALKRAMAGLGVSLGILLGAMQTLSVIAQHKGISKVSIVSGALIMISTAMLILSGAIKRLSSLSWGELTKGLVGVAAALGVLSLAVIPLSKNSSGMIRAGAGLILVATGLRIMANAIATMGAMDMLTIAKGLGATGAALLIIAGSVRLMPNMLGASSGLLVLSVAINIIAKAVSDFGRNDIKALAKGLVAMGAALVIIAGAMRLMPGNMILTAAGLVAVSVALNLIAVALNSMGGMSWSEIAKGLVALGASLLVLAGGLYLMSGSIVGALALAVAAASLALLVPPLIALGSMSWGNIAKGLIALAGALTIIGVAAAIFGLGAPLLIVGGAALLVFGAGLALVGVAALAFAKAFQIAVAAAGAGAETIRAMLDAVIESIPKAMKAFGEGVVEFVKAVGNAHNEFVKAFSKILSSLLTAIINNIPKMATLFDKLIRTGLTIIKKWFPEFVRVGFSLLTKLMDGISKNIPTLVRKATDVVVKFINGIADNLDRVITAGKNLAIKFIKGIAKVYPDIVDAGFKAVIQMIKGVAKAVRENSSDLRAAGRDLAGAIADGMTGGLASKVRSVAGAARNLAGKAVGAIRNVFDSHSPSRVAFALAKTVPEGMVLALQKYSRLSTNAAKNVGSDVIGALKRAMLNVPKIISGDINTNPVVTPVLDLSQIKKSASQIDALVGNRTQVGTVSYSQASSASTERFVAQTQSSAPAEAGSGEIKFVQNNYSPRALTPIEIYRNTKSQLSLAKEALTA